MNEDREINYYEKLAERAKQVFENSREKSGAWIDEAPKKAADQLEEAGEFTKQECNRARQFPRKDLEATKEQPKVVIVECSHRNAVVRYSLMLHSDLSNGQNNDGRPRTRLILSSESQ